MAARLGIIRVGEQSAREMATLSRAAIDRPLRSLAELSVSIAHDEARVLGTFQRGARLRGAPTLLVRGSGGPEVQVGVGTVHVLLALANPGALVDCDEKRIVNRSVRPLLRALNKTMGAAGPAHYFGRDWVSVAHVPAAWVGFAHDATTRRTAFEAFVSVRTPFAEPGRASFRGKVPGTLESIGGRALSPAFLAESIAEAYATEIQSISLDLPQPFDEREPRDPHTDPPWTTTCEEVIGTIGAGPDARGVFRVGGDWLVSRDAVARLEERVARASEADLGRIVDETLAAPGVALEGVRSLRNVCDLIARARGLLESP
jgi:hypothetical protein